MAADTTKKHFIRIRGANVNNLKNLSVDIPRDKFVVFTGLSGSGKSSLAFDTIYAEGSSVDSYNDIDRTEVFIEQLPTECKSCKSLLIFHLFSSSHPKVYLRLPSFYLLQTTAYNYAFRLYIFVFNFNILSIKCKVKLE
mgnify:CR=1 FL=1